LLARNGEPAQANEIINQLGPPDMYGVRAGMFF
jgi:hypothetical protein